MPLDDIDRSYLLNDAALALGDRFPDLAWRLYERTVVLDIETSSANSLRVALSNLTSNCYYASNLADAARLAGLESDLAEAMESEADIFRSRFDLYYLASIFGDDAAADRLWQQIGDMKRPQVRAIYRTGDAEFWHAIDLLRRGELTEAMLMQAEELAREGHNHGAIRSLNQTWGEWYLSRGEPSLAIEKLGHAVRMAREIGSEDGFSEAMLALARLRAGERFDARGEAERLSKTGWGTLALAELWWKLGARDRAVEHALRAHKFYVSDGEPYLWRYRLDRTRALLAELGVPLPEIPKYDPAKAKIYPWEKDVRAFIDKLKAKRKRAQTKKSEPGDVKTSKAKRKSKLESGIKRNPGKRRMAPVYRKKKSR